MTGPRVLDVSSLPAYDISNKAPLWWGQLLMCLIEASLLLLLVAMYFYVRLSVDMWPPPGVVYIFRTSLRYASTILGRSTFFGGSLNVVFWSIGHTTFVSSLLTVVIASMPPSWAAVPDALSSASVQRPSWNRSSVRRSSTRPDGTSKRGAFRRPKRERTEIFASRQS